MSDNDTSSYGRDMAIVPLSIVVKAIMGYLQRPSFLLATQLFLVVTIRALRISTFYSSIDTATISSYEKCV